jgi:FkbM family methyltransferase
LISPSASISFCEMSLNYRHLPRWLEENRVFRFFFLLRKLFFIKKSFKHYSQFAEDVSIVRHFKKGYKGFFVDVGCFHPTKYNNTYRLYKMGWRGVNVDLDSIKIQGFNIVRPGDVNVARAVSNQSGTVKYWSNGFYSLTPTLDRDFAKLRQGYIEKEVRTESLTEILDRTRYKNQKIDLLSVDVEGHDLEVLKSLDFNRYRPRMIVVETNEKSLDQVLKSELYQMLSSLRYSVVNWVGITLIFMDQDRPSDS